MFNKHLLGQPRFAAPDEGWAEYQQALDLIEQSSWAQALLALAQAETSFHAVDDPHGLWRALLGQALLHWREGTVALAMARAAAALHAAEASDDGFAVGCVAWQIATMLLGQGEYRRAAEYLDQAQLALDAVAMAPPGGTLAAAAQLCCEIVRWQQRYERQQIGRHDAETAIGEIQHDLMQRLGRAASSMRAAPLMPAPFDGADGAAVLLPTVPALLEMPGELAQQAGLGAWLRRLWRRLVYGDDLPAVEPLMRAPELDLPPEPAPAEPPALVLRAHPPAADAARAYTGATVAIEPGQPAAPEQPPEQLPAASDTAEAAPPAQPGLRVKLLGGFRVVLNGYPIESWPSGRGRAVFKYLLAHHDRPIPRDVLMEAFWPEASNDAARNSLNVALYGLRQALRAAAPVPVVLFQDGAYRLDPALRLELDLDEFKHCVQAGRRAEEAGDIAAATAHYQQAAALYAGDFMADDLGDDWPVLLRERLRVAYLDTLDRLGQLFFAQEHYEACATLCLQLLGYDSCREDAHCRLMRCYSRLGQHHLALRQYQACVEALHKELGVEPDDATRQLCERVRRREAV